jgi:N-acetyl-anhydromuramyl-L-alanine amidase AmpD
MASDDAFAIWSPSSNANVGREGTAIAGIIDHITEGTDSLAWLRGAAGGSSNRDSSAHYLVSRDGTIHQLVREADTAWGAGNWAYNLARINIEHEGHSGEPLTNAQIQSSGKLHGRIADRHGFTLQYGKTVIGHSAVPDPYNPTLFGGVSHHTRCPGSAFPWSDIIQIGAALPHQSGGTTPAPVVPPEQEYFSQSKHWISHGFLRYWHGAGGLIIFGFPISEEYTDERGIIVQWFERARFEWQSKIAPNEWGVVLGLLGSEASIEARSKHPDAFADKAAA